MGVGSFERKSTRKGGMEGEVGGRAERETEDGMEHGLGEKREGWEDGKRGKEAKIEKYL